jgi:hypothetical protein
VLGGDLLLAQLAFQTRHNLSDASLSVNDVIWILSQQIIISSLP